MPGPPHAPHGSWPHGLARAGTGQGRSSPSWEPWSLGSSPWDGLPVLSGSEPPPQEGLCLRLHGPWGGRVFGGSFCLCSPPAAHPGCWVPGWFVMPAPWYFRSPRPRCLGLLQVQLRPVSRGAFQTAFGLRWGGGLRPRTSLHPGVGGVRRTWKVAGGGRVGTCGRAWEAASPAPRPCPWRQEDGELVWAPHPSPPQVALGRS